MARSTQTAPPSRAPRWIQRQYIDHQGNTVVLGKVSDEGSDFHEPSGRGAYRLQIYSKAPIQPQDYEKLHRYLVNDTETGPILEIYSYNPPDPLACVEHQRREIVHRRRLHADSNRSRDELPPLIPTLRYKSEDFSSGFCILLTSESYQAGQIVQERKERGSAPFWIYFDRRLPSEIRELDLTSRLSASVHDVSNFVQLGIQVFPEARDIEVSIKNSQEKMDVHTRMALTGAFRKDSCQIDYGLDEQVPERPEPATLYAQQVREILEQQQTAEIQSVDPSTLRLDRPGERVLTITNSSEEEKGESDLQYTVYIPFLANLQDSVIIETTARIFTAAIISRLSGNKTVHFEFRVHHTSSLSSILSSHSNEPQPGALHSFEDGSRRERVPPLSRSDVTTFPGEAYKDFCIILDKPALSKSRECCSSSSGLILRRTCQSSGAVMAIRFWRLDAAQESQRLHDGLR
ncbi:hypothetical protein PHISCL_03564 [Aspergillus sclerotialis]|uniref:Uncharacterized protein n=1 Tax=Aspergillus sclerotialis TaxID=2070753 RepID=A0A3A2ZLN9_9EURO|nr:hypothetical protein PHISCL_03564 [Aspergillus sclerotialis]